MLYVQDMIHGGFFLGAPQVAIRKPTPHDPMYLGRSTTPIGHRSESKDGNGTSEVDMPSKRG